MKETMTSVERVRKALNFEEADRVPVIPHIMYPTSRITGITVAEFATDGKKMAKALMEAQRYFQYDGVSPHADVTVEGEAVGSVVNQPEYAPAFVVKPVIEKPADLLKLKVPDPYAAGRMPVFLEATDICNREMGDEIYVLSCIQGPLNTASQLRGVENIMYDFYDNPDFLVELLEFSSEVSSIYAKALIKAGARGIIIGEALCSPAFLSPNKYRSLLVDIEKRQIEKIHAYGAESTLLHICGQTKDIWIDAAQTGATFIDLDWQVDMGDARKTLDKKMALRGNIDPAAVLLNGTPALVEKKVCEVIRQAAEGGGLIVGSGCDIGYETPFENIIAMVEATKNYGFYPIANLHCN